ncbi:MAG: hypothetical protein AB1513_07530 [Pseudomonadota bacterium]
MKSKVLVVVAVMLALGTAYAAEEKAAGEKAVEQKVDGMETPKSKSKKKMKKHSHMEEKTGMPMPMREEGASDEVKKPLHEHRKEHNKN